VLNEYAPLIYGPGADVSMNLIRRRLPPVRPLSIGSQAG